MHAAYERREIQAFRDYLSVGCFARGVSAPNDPIGLLQHEFPPKNAQFHSCWYLKMMFLAFRFFRHEWGQGDFSQEAGAIFARSIFNGFFSLACTDELSMAAASIPLERMNGIQSHEVDLCVLNEIARLLTDQHGQRQMLGEVLKLLDQRLSLARGTVMLLSPDGSELIVAAAPDIPGPTQSNYRYRYGEGIIGQVVQTGQAAIVPQVFEEPRFTNRLYQRQPGTDADTAFVCVPIALGSEVVGTLSVDMASDDGEQLQERRRFWKSLPA